MGVGQLLTLVLLLGAVTVIQTCKTKEKQNLREIKPLHSADYVENEHIFVQFPEPVGEANIDLPDMLILPVEFHLAPSWRNKFGELEGRHRSMEILEIVQKMFLHYSLKIKFSLKYNESSIKLSNKEVDLTYLGLKALDDYIPEPVERAAIVYLKVTDSEVSLLGKANQAFICDPQKKKARSIVRWRDSPQETALVVAHEIGHILGIYHDFDKYVRTDKRPTVRISRRTHTCGPGEYNGGPNNKIMNYGTPISSSWSECNNWDFISFYKLVTVNVGSFCLEENRIGCESGECYHKTWFYQGKEQRACANPGDWGPKDWCPTRDGVDESNNFVLFVDGRITNKWTYCTCGGKVPGCESDGCLYKAWFYEGREQRGCAKPDDNDDWCPTEGGLDQFNEYVRSSKRWKYCTCVENVTSTINLSI